jgi:hypothetical protein
MNHFPIIAIEGILVLGGVLLFAWWQFRDLDREAAKTAEREKQLKSGSEGRPDNSNGPHHDSNDAADSVSSGDAASDGGGGSH